MANLALLKMPHHFQNFLSFFLFLGSLLAYWNLNQRNELPIIFSSGVSVSQILKGTCVLVLVINIIHLCIVNPFSAAMKDRFWNLEQKIFNTSKSHRLSVVGTQLWLKENFKQEKAIFFASQFNLKTKDFRNVRMFLFDKNNTFLSYIKAPQAFLDNKKWIFINAVENKDKCIAQSHEYLERPTLFSTQRIEDTFIPPDMISFFKLPSVIRLLDKQGIPSKRYTLYWHLHLSKILFMMSLCCFSVLVCLRPPRYHGMAKLLSSSLLMCFVLYFLNDLVCALGLSQQISVIVSAWFIPCFSCLLFLFFWIHHEEH